MFMSGGNVASDFINSNGKYCSINLKNVKDSSL